MPMAKLTSKNQITIPAEVRNHLGLKPGDTIRWTREGEAIFSIRKVPPLSSFSGRLKSSVSLSDAELTEAIKDARRAMATGDDWP